MLNNKTLLIHDYAGHPFTFELAKSLASNRYNVIYIYTSASNTPKANFHAKEKKLHVINIPIFTVDKGNFFQRALHEFQYGKKLKKLIRHNKPNLIISANTPLLAQKQLVALAKKHNIPFIFWLQDLLSLAALSILPKRFGLFGKIIANYFKHIEKYCLKNASKIITVTEDFHPVLKKWQIKDTNIQLIYNWAPIERITVHEKKNTFSKKYALHNKFVVLYSGTLGMKHNPRLLFETAKLLSDIDDITFVIITEGIGAEFINNQIKEYPLKNVLLLPFQPFDMLPQVLASADVLLVILEKQANKYCVPSKIWSGFCSERPSILVVPESNLSARITKKIQAGIIINNDTPENLAKAILNLKNDDRMRVAMGENARMYAEKHFPIDKVTSKFDAVFRQVMLGGESD